MKFARFRVSVRFFSQIKTDCNRSLKPLKIQDVIYNTDEITNVTSKIVSFVGKNLHNRQFNPLCLTKQKIVNYFYSRFKNNAGNPIFSIYDDLKPVVTVQENFDMLLTPKDHVSRAPGHCYYINTDYLLRAHMTAHQSELIKMGLDNFIVFGDVYRRDEIDSTHYPVFHQCDAVMLFHKHQLESLGGNDVQLFENCLIEDNAEKQSVHTIKATKIVEDHLKSTLVGLIKSLFGNDINYRWVTVYFPFTQPSWELEIETNGKWMEILGCGVVRHKILLQAGAEDRIGWAFGIGLERLAMLFYDIPDIRLFWSNDSGFLCQFKDKSPDDIVKYKPISIYPQCCNDISFWLPDNRKFEANDFLEIVREVGGDIIEQVNLIDQFTNPKTSKSSLCYRIIYRHLERTLTQAEVNKVHKAIEDKATKQLGITVR